jgi:hypothetical protein
VTLHAVPVPVPVLRAPPRLLSRVPPRAGVPVRPGPRPQRRARREDAEQDAVFLAGYGATRVRDFAGSRLLTEPQTRRRSLPGNGRKRRPGRPAPGPAAAGDAHRVADDKP